MSLKNIFIPKFIKEYIIYFKKNGFKKTVKKFGWRLFAAIFIFYLIRDTILYLIINDAFRRKKWDYFWCSR